MPEEHFIAASAEEIPAIIQANAIWGNTKLLLSEAVLLEGMATRLRERAADIRAATIALKDLALAPKA